MPQNVNPELFQIFNSSFKLNTEPKFLKTPNNPINRSTCLASQYYTALSTVNIIDYGEYAWADNETVAVFRNVEKKLPIGSLETTHGVIRLSSDIPMFFISAITDKEGNFDMEVTSGQNYTAAFNSGIILGQFLSDFSSLIIKTPDFNLNFTASN